MRFTTVLLLSLVFTIPVLAYGPEEPTEVIEAFHEALAAGDSDRALSYLAPDIVIFESGYAEMSREEYAAHHLESDMKFSGAVKTEITDQQMGGTDDVAWVISRTKTTGTYGERSIDSIGDETMILERGDDGWRIRHIHWSSRNVAPRE